MPFLVMRNAPWQSHYWSSVLITGNCTHPGVGGRPGVSDALQLELQASVSWEPPHPLEERQVLLATEPSLPLRRLIRLYSYLFRRGGLSHRAWSSTIG